MVDRRTLVVGFGITVGNIAQSAVPWIVGALHESAGMDIEQASLMTTIEMFAMGLVMFAMSTVVHRLPKKAVLGGALLICIAAQAFTMLAGGVWQFAVARALSGVGFGIVYSLVSAIGAGADSPERTFGTAGTILLLLGTLINPLLGFGLQHHGYRGVFAGIILLTVVLSFPLCLISFKKFVAVRPLIARTEAAKAVDDPRINPLAAACVVLTMGGMGFALTGAFAFVQQIAHHVGLAGTVLGGGMSVVSLVSASGGVLAGLVAKRVSSTLPLMIGLPTMGIVILSMTMVDTALAFWVVFTLLVLLYWFLYPFIFGLASAVDPLGRIASGTASGKILFSSGGTALAGFVAARYGMVSYGYCAVGICLLAALCAAGVIIIVRPHGPAHPLDAVPNVRPT